MSSKGVTMQEKFTIPAVGGIVESEIKGEKAILMQTRKKDSIEGTGFFEIPAGKIREFENIFDCLRREIKEETGLDVIEIYGEKKASVVKNGEYKVVGYEPFYCSQNTTGVYPIMVTTFICKVEGEQLSASNESENIGFVTLTELRQQLTTNREQFYPMHIAALEKYLNTMEY